MTCDHSQEKVHFLDVQVILENTKISTDLYVKKRIVISTLILRRVNHTITLSRFLLVKLYDSIEHSRTRPLVTIVTSYKSGYLIETINKN